MFKFNFNVEDVDSERSMFEKISNTLETRTEKSSNDDANLNNEISINCANINQIDSVFKKIVLHDIIFHIIDLDDVKEFQELDFLKDFKNCDVVPTIYEGGLKIWECTFDLLNFLINTNINFSGKKVLDLGCGCGLLGIFAGIKNAKSIHFQDYNAEVIQNVTIPNVIKNGINSQCETKFYFNDWELFTERCSEKYDYILASEVLYNPSNYRKLLELFSKILTDDGQIFIASKSYYFGVGGSVTQFENFLNDCNTLKHHCVWRITDGVQREIIVLENSSNIPSIS